MGLGTRLSRTVAAGAAAVLASCGSGPSGDNTARTSEALQQCTMQTVEGIDVFDGQGTINWTSVKGAGIAFAMIKATQGTYDTQPTFSADWSGSRAAGVYRSAYHFFDPTEDGTAQAQHFLSVVGALAADDLSPMLDIECPDGSANCLASGKSGQATAAEIHQRMWDFVNTVESATGRKPIVYTFGSYFSSNGIDTTGLADLPLFIADITTSACINVPSPWALATFWQYSWTGTVAGVTGQVDRDRFVGSLASLKAYLSMPPSSQDEVEAGPEASSQSGDGSAGSDAAASPGVDEAAASDLVGAEEAGQAGQDGSPRSAGKATAAAAAGCACSMARSSRSTGGLLFGLLLIGGLAARRVRSRCTPEERIRS